MVSPYLERRLRSLDEVLRARQRRAQRRGRPIELAAGWLPSQEPVTDGRSFEPSPPRKPSDPPPPSR